MRARHTPYQVSLGVGKKHVGDPGARKEKPFGYEDLRRRVTVMPDPERQSIRVMIEIKARTSLLFVGGEEEWCLEAITKIFKPFAHPIACNH